MNFMDKLTEIKDAQNHAYILGAPDLFFPVGYKVLLGQEKNGFIKCTRVTHNGKDKLVYDTSRFKTLESLMYGLMLDEMLDLLIKFLDAIILVKNNGFMQCENILVSPDHIFVDCDNSMVNLIYLPIYHESDSVSYSIFEAELKADLLIILGAYNEKNPFLHTLCGNMNNPYFTVEEVHSALKELQLKESKGGFSLLGGKKKDRMMQKEAEGNDVVGNMKKLFSFSKKNK